MRDGGSSRTIVVLTPVRNEAWILERFLQVTSRFADVILIADQGSTDESRAICERHRKVVLIENRAPDYGEDERQGLLIDTARRLVSGPRILLALDADELLTADSIDSPGWQQIRHAPPGTVLCFEKPDLYLTTSRCIRYRDGFWPLGFVDDGSAHRPRKIHSIRIPTPAGAPRFDVDGVRFMHLALARPKAQKAKLRLYAVLENLHGTNPLRRRRAWYAATTFFGQRAVEPAPPEWFDGWEADDIALRRIEDDDVHWQDFEVLRLFSQHGTGRFWADPIWDVDWEALRVEGLRRGISDMPTAPIDCPPRVVTAAWRLHDTLWAAGRRLARHVS